MSDREVRQRVIRAAQVEGRRAERRRVAEIVRACAEAGKGSDLRLIGKYIDDGSSPADVRFALGLGPVAV